MNKELLRYYEKIHATYLHAYSEAGTEFLLQELCVKDNEHVLEIGFGTGGTLVKMRARHSSLKLCGIEQSAEMLHTASSRLKFCGIRDVNLHWLTSNSVLPFTEGLFDKIYAESVLGIQKGKEPEFLLREIHRVLKPGGRVILNETVWLPEISQLEIETINTSCEKLFGIIQSSSEYPNSKHWLQLLKTCGFSQVESKCINPIKKKTIITLPELLSNAYTFIGKLKKLNPSLLKESRAFEKNMGILFTDKQYMEGILFSALK